MTDQGILDRQQRDAYLQKFQADSQAAADRRAALGVTGSLTAADKANLDLLYANARRTGEESLGRFGTEIAGQRGLRTSDSPIGNELLRQQGLLSLGLDSARASAELDLGKYNQNLEEQARKFNAGAALSAFGQNQGFNINQQQYGTGLGQQAYTSQRDFMQNLAQFQQGLQQQAFENRLALGTAAPLSYNLANQLAQNRFKGISQTTNQSLTPGIGQIGGAIGGIGIGIGALSR